MFGFNWQVRRRSAPARGQAVLRAAGGSRWWHGRAARVNNQVVVVPFVPFPPAVLSRRRHRACSTSTPPCLNRSTTSRTSPPGFVPPATCRRMRSTFALIHHPAVAHARDKPIVLAVCVRVCVAPCTFLWQTHNATVALSISNVGVPAVCPAVPPTGYAFQLVPEPDSGCDSVTPLSTACVNLTANQNPAGFQITVPSVTDGAYCVIARIIGFKNTMEFASNTLNVRTMVMPGTWVANAGGTQHGMQAEREKDTGPNNATVRSQQLAVALNAVVTVVGPASVYP